ncbi:MAG: pyridoxamine 5'-phosphate oxidase family protein [Mycobacteriaceae bacterium]
MGITTRSWFINSDAQWLIEQQQVFFVGTAAESGQVNVSPKGRDSLRVVDPNTLVWLNGTGSGNETAAHLSRVNRMTIMFCAFSGPPKILRLYRPADVHHAGDPEWDELVGLFPPLPGARNVFVQYVELSTGVLRPGPFLVGVRAEVAPDATRPRSAAATLAAATALIAGGLAGCDPDEPTPPTTPAAISPTTVASTPSPTPTTSARSQREKEWRAKKWRSTRRRHRHPLTRPAYLIMQVRADCRRSPG